MRRQVPLQPNRPGRRRPRLYAVRRRNRDRAVGSGRCGCGEIRACVPSLSPRWRSRPSLVSGQLARERRAPRPPPIVASGARCTSGSTQRRLISGLLKSPATDTAIRLSSLVCWHRFRRLNKSAVSVGTARTGPKSAMRDSCARCSCGHCGPPQRTTMEGRWPGHGCPQ